MPRINKAPHETLDEIFAIFGKARAELQAAYDSLDNEADMLENEGLFLKHQVKHARRRQMTVKYFLDIFDEVVGDMKERTNAA